MSLLWKEARVGDNDFGAGPVERSGTVQTQLQLSKIFCPEPADSLWVWLLCPDCTHLTSLILTTKSSGSIIYYYF